MCVTYDGVVDWNAYGVEIEKDLTMMAHIAENEKVQESKTNETK